MNLETLKKVIKEEVRNSIREELRDLIVEAVLIASTPDSLKKDQEQVQQAPTPSVDVKQTVRKEFSKLNPIEALMNETKLSFTSADAKNFSHGGNQVVGNTASAMAHNLGMMDNAPGLDINSLPFLKNAKTILDLSKQKDKERLGGN